MWCVGSLGVDGIVNFLQVLDKNVALLAFVPGAFVCSNGDVVRFVYERNEVKANGNQYDNYFLVSFTLINGEISTMQNYMDTARIAAAFCNSNSQQCSMASSVLASSIAVIVMAILALMVTI